MEIREIIKEIGVREGLTQSDMSKMAGFDHRPNFTVSINKGNISLRRFRKLCKETGYKVVLIKNKNKIEL